MNYKVPFVNYPLSYQKIKEEIDNAVKRIFEKGDLILREDVEEFERKMAEFVGVKYAVGVNSCTDALTFSLKAAGIKEGDEIITVSHTFFATIEAIKHCGATPVLVDVRDDFLIDPEQVKKAVNKKTKAILPVHLNGRVCDMEKLGDFNLPIIEDAAQSLGASLKQKKAGSFGIAGCFSFYPAKILGGFGDGGMVTTNNEEIADTIRLLRNHGQKTKEEIALYGFTSRLHNLQAALLNVKMRYLPQWIARRREIAAMYHKGLFDIASVKLPPAPERNSSRFDVYQNYVLRAQKRDKLFDYLKEQGVETLVKDRVPNHKQSGLGLAHFSLPLTEQLAKEVISLPIYPELTDQQVECVISAVRDFYDIEVQPG